MASMDVNLKVLVMDTDFYALQSLNGYLAWDRRTRVTNLSENLDEMWQYLAHTSTAEMPDIVLLEADHLGGAAKLSQVVAELRRKIDSVKIICLAQTASPDLAEAAADSGAAGFLLKQEVRLQIAWAVVYSLEHDFIVTSGIAKACRERFNHRLFHATLLPEMRKFPELTGRIRQALELCVLRGLTAQVAADEMGISLHTIRGYIKEGYRILEAYDDTEYPVYMTPQERALMRFTAFEEKVSEDEEAERNHAGNHRPVE
jgi:DNA-binding NarL/FixJ family response regulator